MKLTWPWVLAAAWALFLPLCAGAEVAVPTLKSRVTDLTATLSAGQSSELEQTLAAFEARKGSQIAVLIIPSTQPEAVEQYAVRVQEAWKLGRKGIDDGVLLLVAKDDRSLWMEVGYGLEGALPDAIAKRIIEEEIVPRFKQGDFYGGINAGVQRVIKVIDGEALPEPKRAAPRGQRGQGWDPGSFLIIGVMLVMVVGGILRAIFGRFLGASMVGGIAGYIAWTMAGALMVGVVAAIIAFIFALAGGTRRGLGGLPGGWSSGRGGGFGGGGFGGGGFGGFGGGGGMSGGGGAGGRW